MSILASVMGGALAGAGQGILQQRERRDRLEAEQARRDWEAEHAERLHGYRVGEIEATGAQQRLTEAERLRLKEEYDAKERERRLKAIKDPNTLEGMEYELAKDQIAVSRETLDVRRDELAQRRDAMIRQGKKAEADREYQRDLLEYKKDELAFNREKLLAAQAELDAEVAASGSGGSAAMTMEQRREALNKNPGLIRDMLAKNPIYWLKRTETGDPRQQILDAEEDPVLDEEAIGEAQRYWLIHGVLPAHDTLDAGDLLEAISPSNVNAPSDGTLLDKMRQAQRHAMKIASLTAAEKKELEEADARRNYWLTSGDPIIAPMFRFKSRAAAEKHNARLLAEYEKSRENLSMEEWQRQMVLRSIQDERDGNLVEALHRYNLWETVPDYGRSLQQRLREMGETVPGQEPQGPAAPTVALPAARPLAQGSIY